MKKLLSTLLISLTLFISNAQTIDLDGEIGRLATYRVLGSGISGGEVIQYTDGGFLGAYSAGLTIANYVPSTGGSNGSAGGDASYGLDVYNYVNNGGRIKQGALVGIQGFVTGDQSFSIGVSGAAMSFTPGVKYIGVTGVAGTYGAGSTQVGVYAGVNAVADNGIEVNPESCGLLVDTRSTGLPAAVMRKGNGELLLKVTDKGEIQTKAPEGTASASIKFGTVGNRLIMEVNGEKFFIRLERVKGIGA